MPFSTKPLSDKSETQVLQAAINDADKTLGTSGYITSKIGAKMTVTNFQVNPAIDDYRFLDVIQTLTCNTSLGMAQITGMPTLNLAVGQYVFGTNIPANTTIVSVDSDSQVTLSNTATGSGAESLQFANLLYILRLSYNDANRDMLVVAERIA